MVSPAIFLSLLWKRLTTGRARLAAAGAAMVALGRSVVPHRPV